VGAVRQSRETSGAVCVPRIRRSASTVSPEAVSGAASCSMSGNASKNACIQPCNLLAPAQYCSRYVDGAAGAQRTADDGGSVVLTQG